MPQSSDLTKLSHAEKDALIVSLLAQLAAAHERIVAQDARIVALEARLDELTPPTKNPDNSSTPPSRRFAEMLLSSGLFDRLRAGAK